MRTVELTKHQRRATGAFARLACSTTTVLRRPLAKGAALRWSGLIWEAMPKSYLDHLDHGAMLSKSE